MQERAKDAQGNVYLTIDEIRKQEEERRAGQALTCNASQSYFLAKIPFLIVITFWKTPHASKGIPSSALSGASSL